MIGIYAIKCKKENKVYIGQSKQIEKRYREHINKLKRQVHQNHYLQEAFNEFGEENFCCEILFELNESEFTRQKLYDLEIEYIKLYDSTNREKGYNLDSGGNSKNRASLETRKKLSKAMTGKYVGRKMSDKTKLLMKQNHSHYWLGKHHSEETKKLFSLQRKGKPSHLKGKTQTEEHIKKRTDVQFGKVWVNNGTEERFVFPEEKEKFLNNGYNLGRIFRKRNRKKKII